MSEPTPGEWEIEEHENWDKFFFVGPVRIDNDDVPKEEADANARLVSAAKPLLAAAQALFDVPHQEHLATRLNDAKMAALDALRAAIAKAQGK